MMEVQEVGDLPEFVLDEAQAWSSTSTRLKHRAITAADDDFLRSRL